MNLGWLLRAFNTELHRKIGRAIACIHFLSSKNRPMNTGALWNESRLGFRQIPTRDRSSVRPLPPLHALGEQLKHLPANRHGAVQTSVRIGRNVYSCAPLSLVAKDEMIAHGRVDAESCQSCFLNHPIKWKLR